MGNILLGLITFLAAFLLFQVELIIAKVFLPAYGGSYLVWGACIVFFQAVLLLGYWFAHHFISRLGWARYRFLHLTLLPAALLFFPGRELNMVFAPSSLPLVLDVFLRLVLTIGPVFFVLSTMSIATQMWLSRSRLSGRLNPYALYAVSNFGSFAALLSYPFWIELYLALPQQIAIWRGLYLLLLLMNLAAFFFISIEKDEAQREDVSPAEGKVVGRWILLGAGASMMFLSVNNLMTYELPPVPLFWIFPLSIYLLSFVLNFKKNPWCPRWIKTQIASIIGFSALFYLLVQKYNLPPLVEFAVFLGILFCVCMFCQDALIQSKPQQQRLTSFYFYISLGSFIGGIVTTWIIPLISVSMVEYLCALFVVAISFLGKESLPAFSARALRVIIYLSLLYYLWSAFFVHYNIFAILVLLVLNWEAYQYLGRFRYGVVVSLLVLLVTLPAQEKMWDRRATDNTWKIRNYYGIHEIVDSSQVRWLYHGRTLHGGQMLSPLHLFEPITYYGPHSGAWDVINKAGFHFQDVALIGLGTGTATSYFKKGQSMDIFELDPDVYKIAMDKFFFLKYSQSSRRVFIGDARISLKAVNDRKYDLILIDAFGGDAIPVHLLTTDVFKEYRSHMNDQGLILIHVSNRYVDLIPVLARVAEAVGAQISFKLAFGFGPYHTGSYWMVITWDDDVSKKISSVEGWEMIRPQKYPGRPWTDGYSSVLPVIKLDYLWASFKNFKFFSW